MIKNLPCKKLIIKSEHHFWNTSTWDKFLYCFAGMAELERHGGARPPPPWYDRSDNPILTRVERGEDYAHHIITCPPLNFQTFRYPCVCKNGNLGLLYSSSMAFFPNYVLLIIGCSTDPIFELYELVTV